MTSALELKLGRTNVCPVSFGYDISADVFVSEIRDEIDPTSTLIATWSTSFLTDGTDGELLLTLEVADLAAVTQRDGWMDIKRVSGGKPYTVNREPIKVLFTKAVTA